MKPQNSGPVIRAGIFLGIGLGGFLDGIILHQILQTHSMLSGKLGLDTLSAVKVSMFWDGLFHAFTWLMTTIGIALLWRAARDPAALWSGKMLVSAQLVGWGGFNLLEGIVDHHILHAHHVVERLGVSMFDYGFLLLSALMVMIGWFGIRSAEANSGGVPAKASGSTV
ncbi:MAG TPA: DUF2243 domain-containing protein [Methylomirabilota bacterium]|nr:DUF2243 domain-containing protein [Methylomirabilota bacterium]